ncbi:MarR family winged helix-turn-helix transcriptional regulator [Solirubrobacter phytolaccae]|nr:MarR family transcriptional regulator [Solirubrobacter phytolaccae]
MPGWVAVEAILRAGRAAIDELHRRLAERGHPDVRPAHGYAFQAIGADGTTAGELGVRLNVTKQAAGQMVDELTRLGYVTREPDPDDGRRRLVQLTPRGVDCLRVSAAIFEEIVAEWRARGDDVDVAVAALAGLADLYGGRLRPIW